MTRRRLTPRRRSPVRRAKPESPAAEMLTVGWMLSVLTSLGCETGWVIARLLAAWQPAALHFDVLSRVLLFAATVVGLVSMGLAVAVFQMRRQRVPLSVTLFAVIVAGLPLLAAAVSLLP